MANTQQVGDDVYRGSEIQTEGAGSGWEEDEVGTVVEELWRFPMRGICFIGSIEVAVVGTAVLHASVIKTHTWC